jgi:hypothetical protein
MLSGLPDRQVVPLQNDVTHSTAASHGDKHYAMKAYGGVGV